MIRFFKTLNDKVTQPGGGQPSDQTKSIQHSTTPSGRKVAKPTSPTGKRATLANAAHQIGQAKLSLTNPQNKESAEAEALQTLKALDDAIASIPTKDRVKESNAQLETTKAEHLEKLKDLHKPEEANALENEELESLATVLALNELDKLTTEGIDGISKLPAPAKGVLTFMLNNMEANDARKGFVTDFIKSYATDRKAKMRIIGDAKVITSRGPFPVLDKTPKQAQASLAYFCALEALYSNPDEKQTNRKKPGLTPTPQEYKPFLNPKQSEGFNNKFLNALAQSAFSDLDNPKTTYAFWHFTSPKDTSLVGQGTDEEFKRVGENDNPKLTFTVGTFSDSYSEITDIFSTAKKGYLQWGYP